MLYLSNEWISIKKLRKVNVCLFNWYGETFRYGFYAIMNEKCDI